MSLQAEIGLISRILRLNLSQLGAGRFQGLHALIIFLTRHIFLGQQGLHPAFAGYGQIQAFTLAQG